MKFPTQNPFISKRLTKKELPINKHVAADNTHMNSVFEDLFSSKKYN